MEAFEDAIERGANPNAIGWKRTPSLVVAFHSGRPDFARRLIECGADPHNIGTDRRGDTLLIRAARIGDFGMLSVLLDAGVDPDESGQCERTAFHHAAKQGFDYMTQKLVETNANPNVEDCDLDTPAHLAARYGHGGVIRELLRVCPDITMLNRANWTASHEAVAGGYSDIARTLIDRSSRLLTSQDFSRLLNDLRNVAESYKQDAVCEVLYAFP